MKPKFQVGDRVVYQGSALTIEDHPDQLSGGGTVRHVDEPYLIVLMDDGTNIDGMDVEFFLNQPVAAG